MMSTPSSKSDLKPVSQAPPHLPPLSLKVASRDTIVPSSGDSPTPTSSIPQDSPQTILSHEKDLERASSRAETLPFFREGLLISIVVLAQFTTQVGLGQTLAILKIIGQSFGLEETEYSWLIAGFSLTVGSFILISGRFGDLFGYKLMLIIGYGWYSLWSMIAGLSVYSSHVLFVFARVFQGLGPAIILPNGLALLGVMYGPGRKKDMLFAIFGATAPIGAMIGAVFAALFGEFASWPWAFWSFAVALAGIAILGSIVIPRCPRETGDAQLSLRQKLGLLDIPGAVVGITALVLFNFAWNQAPIVGWCKAYVWIPLILGVCFAVLFFYIELKVSRNPLLPFDALTADVGFVLACVPCGWASFGIWIYYLWIFLEDFRHISPLLASAQLSPLAVAGALAAVCTGMLLSRAGPAWIMTMALTAFLVGNILIGTAPIGQTYWAQVFVCVIVIPWGMDMSFPAATVILSNSVKKEHQGIAASLVSTVVNYSISLGLGFAGTVETQTNRGGITVGDHLKGLRGAYYMSFGLAGLGLILSVIFVVRSYWKIELSRRSMIIRSVNTIPTSPGFSTL